MAQALRTPGDGEHHSGDARASERGPPRKCRGRIAAGPAPMGRPGSRAPKAPAKPVPRRGYENVLVPPASRSAVYFVRTRAVVTGDTGGAPPSVSVRFAVWPGATPKRT